MNCFFTLLSLSFLWSPLSFIPRKKYERDGSSETREKGRLLGTKMSSYKYSRKKMAFSISRNRACPHIKKLRGRGYCTSNDHTIKILYPRNCLILEVHDVYTMMAPFSQKAYIRTRTRDHTCNEIQRHSRNIVRYIRRTLKLWIKMHVSLET
jgi:hypothetical protein